MSEIIDKNRHLYKEHWYYTMKNKYSLSLQDYTRVVRKGLDK